MKFNHNSDEEACGEHIQFGKWKYEVVCMRTKGHKGDHIPVINKAGEADGVRWCCRVKLEEPHTEWCPLVSEIV